MSKRAGLIFFSAIFALFCIWRYFSSIEHRRTTYNLLLRSFSSPTSLTPLPAKPFWINVFIHGTVGTAFSFLDFSSVKADQIENSIYKKTVNLLRRNKYFYQDQPIAEKGLIRVEPAFEFIARDECYYAAYPILCAFEELANFCNQSLEQNVYYLFGWSGYLSQTRRRLEAIRFYNQLAEEVATYEKLGFKPKIRILAHSHGGNIALNLAGIYHSLNKGPLTDKFYENFEISSYIKPLFDKALATSWEKEVATTKKGQKRFAYCPLHKDLFVDELIMLATPIQVETSLFALSPFFGTTYNIYSEGDVIQWMDYVSTVKRQSLQRIDDFDIKGKKFHQICVKIGQRAEGNTERAKNEKVTKPPASMWQVLLGLKDTSRKSPDPTHKEFWYLVPHDNTPYNFLRPLPIVCLFPIIRKLQAKIADVQDADLEITKTEKGYQLRLTDKENSACESINVEENLLENLRAQLIPWVKSRDNSKVMRGIMDKLIDMHRKINM